MMVLRKIVTRIPKEGIPMVRVASLFSQLLSHIPRTSFQSLVVKHQAERGAKGFHCWTQLVAMLFCHLAHADSLREICCGLRCCLGKLKHLGVKIAPNKSTLSYANGHRPAALFEDLYYQLYGHLQDQGGFGHRKSRFRFKNKLLSLDATTITLCLSLFPWASYRRTKGGVKVNVLLDHDHYMPSFVRITTAKEHEVSTARTLSLAPKSIVAMDRAYNDYELFGSWCDNDIFFVTRMKEGTRYEVIDRNPLPNRANIMEDEVVILASAKGEQVCPHPLRRIEVWDDENDRIIVLLTNHLDFGPTTIAAIYKERWEVELFFKTLKQNLKVKTFVGTSDNALRIQIWTALIALLMLKWMHYTSKAAWSFSNMASMVRLNLFTHRDLRQWLDEPFLNEPLQPGPQQQELNLPGLGQREGVAHK
jgi:hypothetical protein